MSEIQRKRELGRGERVVPGLWRLRLPLPWVGIPHCNAWAIASGSGIVLVDCGMHLPGSLANLERALDQVNLRLGNVRQLAITHAHSDHWGQSSPVKDAAGCEMWMHPNHAHATANAGDPEAVISRRLEVGRQSGVPLETLLQYHERHKNDVSGIAKVIEPDAPLVDGVTIDSDLGPWDVYETPGHCPSHICLFQPEHRILISGDHVLGRISLFMEYGWSPDPVGEFLASLDLVDSFDARLALSGHGRPFTDVHAHIESYRKLVSGHLEAVAEEVQAGPRTALELARVVYEVPLVEGNASWLLAQTLCYLKHLELQGHITHETDDEVDHWRAA
jgi:glyoxylase-like metal-dependent hydrolase (beta-lactamase superfamily II)